eukprot:8819906-Heterocapsa_arctica.AAC.1
MDAARFAREEAQARVRLLRSRMNSSRNSRASRASTRSAKSQLAAPTSSEVRRSEERSRAREALAAQERAHEAVPAPVLPVRDVAD